MKTTTAALLTGFLTFATLSSFAQDAKEIVKKHNEAIGGTEKWSKITSLIKDGTTSVMGMDMPMTISILKGKGMRQDFSVMGAKNYVILTPTAGWSFLPVQGQSAPQPLPAEQLKDVAGELDFQDKLMEADAQKHAIELLGKEDLDGKPVFKLKAVDADKDEHTYYVDAATFYLVKVTEKGNVMGQEMEVSTKYSNHTKLPSGIVMAMKEDSGDAGILTLTKIEENTIKDESIFKP